MNKDQTISREKQIEDIANILWHIPNGYYLNSYNDCERIAECIYDDGDYRKQSEGEWEFVEKEAFWICNMEESLKTGKPTKELMPVCSVCKTLFGKIVLEFKFCPECGAKMLKGE